MIELDGRAYTIKTAQENTADMLTAINDYCAQHDIRNSKGELIALEAKMSSPLYCILWALGYLATAIQNLIYSIGASNNVQASSDSQLLNIAQMANVKRGKPSVTTVSILVTAMSAEDPDYDAQTATCTITSENLITVNGVPYKPAVYPSIVLNPSDSAHIMLVAQEAGNHEISAGQITGFDDTIINLKSVSQPEAATPGQATESVASLRQRIQRRQLSGTFVDRAMDAIRELPGVTVCNIFYNQSAQATAYIGSDQDYCAVPPRMALLIVQGYSTDIAKAYLSYMTAQTVNWTEDAQGQVIIDEHILSPEARASRWHEIQTYTTHANQRIPVLIVGPRKKAVYIKVYIGMTIESKIEQAMKDAVCRLALSLTAGQMITGAMVLDMLKDFQSYQLHAAMISSDEGQTYSFRTTQAQDLLWTFNQENIIIDMPGVS